MNLYYCEDGSRVSEATIKAKRSKFYRSLYEGVAHPICAGCGIKRAEGTAHIIPQARCKVLHKTNWIWSKWNTFPACHSCNIAAETSGESFNSLLNKDYILKVLYEYDRETYHKKI